MSRLLQILVLLVIALAVRPARAFSLLAPLPAAGGEAWQTVNNGYGTAGGDLAGVANLTKEYRWNQSRITYGFDSSYINYFGTNGIAAIEAAFAVFNDVFKTDISTLSQELNEYPLEDAVTGATTTFRDSRKVNHTALALNLFDIKSQAMGLIIEQLGLASPERYTWTLRERETVGPLPITNYLTIMRNFDPVTLTPSRYVNGNRYTYDIIELDNPFRVFPVEFPADPESALYQFASVANIVGGGEETIPPALGIYYTYLTRDDIGGLRYLYSSTNLNWESFAPGTQITAPDFSSITLLTNLDLYSFSTFTFTNPPAVVQAAFPDLLILSNSSYLTTVVEVVRVALTNGGGPWNDPFATNLTFVPVLQTNPVIRYTYTFANVLTNYSTPTTFVQRTVTGFEREPWSTPDAPIFRTNITDVTVPFPSGGFVVVPTNIGQFNFTGFAFTNVFGVTNVIFSTNVTENGFVRPVQISEVTLFTNVIFGVFPFAVQPAPAAVLRGGAGKVTFERLRGAVFTGTSFFHTNTYQASYITNAFGTPTLVTNTFSVVKDQPDILIGAGDLGTVGGPAPVGIVRNLNFQNNEAINSALPPGQGGPGNIFPGGNGLPAVQFVFSNVGPFLNNTRPGIATEAAAYTGFGEGWVWGSFDGSTNRPVVYPKDITLEDVELLITGGITP